MSKKTFCMWFELVSGDYTCTFIEAEGSTIKELEQIAEDVALTDPRIKCVSAVYEMEKPQ